MQSNWKLLVNNMVRHATMILIGIVLLAPSKAPLHPSLLRCTNAYSIGDVDPRALRGVWRLTSLDEGGLPFERRQNSMTPPQSTDPKTIWKLRGFLPMKEFTVYPKKKPSDNYPIRSSSQSSKKQTEIFIKLKDDHTFEQCTSLHFSDGDASKDETFEEKLAMEVSRRERESFAWKGTWDFLDGKLILAADRPEKKRVGYDDDKNLVDGPADTILVGRVSVQSEESLTDNPILEQRQTLSDQDQSMKASSQITEGKFPQNESPEPSSKNTRNQKMNPTQQRNQRIDVHLSVPKGKIKTGKFMYPKHHPSFFEQPIIYPQRKGSFELRQILGDHNAKLVDDDEEDVELFRKQDLVGKRFYLSTFPIPKRQKKGRERWSLKEKRYVQDVYEPSEEEKKKEELKPGKNMQVMAVELFANNTFSTLYGLGSSTVLRGKWSIVGQKRDQLFAQIFRFGFGRSVSGSTYSEGMGLTQNDEKAYWGEITEVEDSNKDSIEDDPVQWSCRKVEINGAVMLGWGLEPTTVGRFKMIEMEDDIDEEGEADDDDDDEISVDITLENIISLDELSKNEDSCGDDIPNPLDLPGAFQ